MARHFSKKVKIAVIRYTNTHSQARTDVIAASTTANYPIGDVGAAPIIV